MNIGILGLGTVGGGVVNVLSKNHAQITRRSGVEIIITAAAVRDINAKRICNTNTISLSQDPFEIVNNPQIEVVLETIGGVDLAKDLVIKALENGKHVITANKALIAKHGNELLLLAQKRSLHLLFEAAVAGGVPIIKALEQGLSANQIEWIAGIINGTSNFILTQMRDKNKDFSASLKQAQALGYAEADPTFDIEGIDAAHKLAILSAFAFGSKLQLEQVSTEGINKISSEDTAFAKELGYTIKHLGIAKKIDGQIEMRVHPTLIPKTQLLANVDGVMNAVLIKGNAVGPTLYYGAGAGDEATASAMIADLISIAKGVVSTDIFGWKNLELLPNRSLDSIQSAFYLRLLAKDKTGVLADISKTLAQHHISVEAVIQKQIDTQNNAHIAIITNIVQSDEIFAAIAKIQQHDFIQDTIKIIRVEHLD